MLIGPLLNLTSYIYTEKVSVELSNINIDIVDLVVDFIEAAEELLFPQLVTSLEKHLIEMYLEQTQSMKSPETETRL